MFVTANQDKKLYVVHVGFYDEQSGIYESHTNFFVAAADQREAKQKWLDAYLSR